jgi:hypothetical protein
VELAHTKSGKPSTTAVARAISAVFGLATGKASDQEAHDDAIEEAIVLIADALTPIASDKPKAVKPNYAALYAALQIDHAELKARYAELKALTLEPVTA